MTGRVVIFNVFGHGNTGDAMLLETLVDLISARRPGARLAGVTFDLAGQRRWMPELDWSERVGNAPRRGPARRAAQALGLAVALLIAATRLAWPLRRLLPLEQRRGVEALAGAELAISCPGGYLEDSNGAYLLNLLQIALARRLAAHVALAPQSIGPIRSRAGRAIAGRALGAADDIFVRERTSLDFVAAVASPATAARTRLAGDLAFWYARPAQVGTAEEWRRLGGRPEKPILGLTVIGWSFPHHPNPEIARRDYLAALAALVDHVAARGTHEVVVFNQVADDLPTGEALAALCPSVRLDRGERESGVLAAMIAECDVFIGSRFHSCIFGLIGATPTGAIAYLPKTRGVMGDLGLEEFVIDIADATGPALIAMFERLASDRVALSDRVRARVARYQAERAAFIDYLDATLGPVRDAA